LANRCLPLMKKNFLKLAYDLTVELKLPHRFNTEKRERERERENDLFEEQRRKLASVFKLPKIGT